MALVSFQDVSVNFGGLPLLDRVHLQVEKGQRVCLLGRNGEGKTSSRAQRRGQDNHFAFDKR